MAFHLKRWEWATAHSYEPDAREVELRRANKAEALRASTPVWEQSKTRGLWATGGVW